MRYHYITVEFLFLCRLYLVIQITNTSYFLLESKTSEAVLPSSSLYISRSTKNLCYFYYQLVIKGKKLNAQLINLQSFILQLREKFEINPLNFKKNVCLYHNY